MKITFDERPGDIFDFFQSLWMANNMNIVDKMKEEYNLRENNVFEEAINEYINDEKIDMKRIKKYTHEEMKTESILVMSDIWNALSIEKYLDFINNLDEYNLIKRWEKTIQFILKNIYDEELEGILENKDKESLDIIKDRIIKLIMDEDISDGVKLETFLLLRNPKEYINEYVKTLKDYLKLYKKVNSKRDKVLKNYNQVFKENINKFGLDYISKQTNYAFKFDEFKEIKVTTTALSGLLIVNENNVCYITIGPYAEKILFNRFSDDAVESNLNFIRNISESTRFKIIQLLKEKDYYGQEIIDALGITKTNAFYHLNLLFSLKAVNIVRESQKKYYTLNRDELRKNLDMFTSKLK